MKSRFLTLSILFWTLFVFSACRSSNNLVDQLALRKSIVDGYITNAEIVANNTNNSQAKTIVKLIRHGLVIAMPNQEGLQVLENYSQSGKPALIIVPLLEKDGKNFNENWKSIQNDKGAGAFYYPEVRTIVLKDNDAISPLWKGIILLHEGNHAGTMMYAPYDWTDLVLFSSAEMLTHEFENKLLLSLGGEKYRSLLEKEVERIKMGSDLEGKVPRRTDYHQEMEGIFGPAFSEREKDIRETHFWINAVFTFLGRNFNNPEEKKTAFMFNLYQEEGRFEGIGQAAQ